MQNQTGSDENGASNKVPAKKAGLLQVALAVFWSFFGIRKHQKWQEDSAGITPVQAIVGGIIGAVIFVFLLIMIVQIVTR